MLWRILPILLGAAWFWACSPTVDEAEPNDDLAHASRLPANGRARGTIGRPDDVDWYKIAIGRDSGVLSLHVGGIRDVDFVLSFRGKDGRELKRIDETGVGGDELALDLGVQRGMYYAVLSNKNPKAANPTQKYVLSSKLESAAGRELEPNDSALTATPLEINSLTRGHYYPAMNLLSDPPGQADEDWFSLRSDRPGLYTLSLDLSAVPNVDPVLEIYDANNYKLKEISAGGVGQGLGFRDLGIRAPAQYFLRLRPRSRGMSNPDVFYELLNELRPYDGHTELEPNDQRADATPFEKDAVTGHIAPAGDVDWYRVNAATSPRQILRADLSSVPGMQLVLTVTDDLGQPLLVVDNGLKETPQVLTGIGLSNATYYLVVSEKTGRAANGRDAYALTKTLVPWQPGLEWEPNDSTATAQAVKIGESVDGYLAPAGDVDYYEFNVYQKGDILCELTGLLNVRWSAELFDQDNKPVLAQQAAKMGEPFRFDRELAAGTYWLKLQGADPGQNNVRDKYTLRLKAR